MDGVFKGFISHLQGQALSIFSTLVVEDVGYCVTVSARQAEALRRRMIGLGL